MTRRLTMEGLEGLVLVVILLTVAGAAGWASFTHVHDWTMRHVPDGTPDAFGWVNAIISELVPVAAFLVIRRRRRTDQPTGYPVVLLIAAALLSLAAQLAVADKSPSGWLLSAVPALAFMALVKLVFTGTGTTTAPAAPTHAEPTPAPLTAEPIAPPPGPVLSFTAPVVPARTNGQVFVSGVVR